MVDRRKVLVGAAGAAGIVAVEAMAQTSPAPAAATPPAESPWAITYIEVDPAQVEAARRLLARYRDAVKDKGSLEFAVFEQMGRPNNFVIVEEWPSAKAREDNAAAAPSRELRAGLAPLLIAPYDERPHFALSTARKTGTDAAVHVVTHADFIPPKREEGSAEVRKLVEAGRGKAGNILFDALVQASRPNHLTIFECWKTAADREAHSAAAPTRAFRTATGPMSGSLYDERLYALLK
jgi:quinol monooxygenase YgiN